MNSLFFVVGGTSCAAPAVGAIVSLLNDVRIRNKKPVLGFGIVTLLYKSSSRNGFVPISTGPANTQPGCPGFSPDVNGGWSPIVGWGGLNYTAMARIVSELPY